MTVPASPQATRHRLPSWLDWRLALGVLLVIGSLVAGARIVGSAQETAQVWAVNSDLSAGTVLKDADVRKVRVRLPDNSSRYVGEGRSPAGQTLSRDIGRDELLPSAALTGPQCGNRVSIPVAAQHVPATIAAGQRIDVYATVKGGQTERVLHSVPVQVVQRPRAGVGGAEWSVVVRVPAGSALAVVRSVRSADIDVTVVDAPAADEPCDLNTVDPGPSPSVTPSVSR